MKVKSPHNVAGIIIALVAFGVALAAISIALVLCGPARADAPDGRGNNTTETRSTGSPDNPRGFGSVTSQRAIDDHDIGAHASSQDEPRLGVGNVSAGDSGLAQIAGVSDIGTRPGDHALIIGELSGYPATNRPGTREDE